MNFRVVMAMFFEISLFFTHPVDEIKIHSHNFEEYLKKFFLMLSTEKTSYKNLSSKYLFIS